jgi:hypothetical protein
MFENSENNILNEDVQGNATLKNTTSSKIGKKVYLESYGC